MDKSLTGSLKQVNTLADLVDEILEASRIHAGRLTLHLHETPLAPLIREIVARFAEQLKKAGCDLRLKLDESIIGFWDCRKMEQVITNFISNIVKHAPGCPALITAVQEQGRARIVFEDKGPGVQQAKHEKIFERFERVAEAGDASGLGLGLFVVKRIVESHQGFVYLESEPGQGSSFTVEVPLRPVTRGDVIVSQWGST